MRLNLTEYGRLENSGVRMETHAYTWIDYCIPYVKFDAHEEYCTYSKDAPYLYCVNTNSLDLLETK